MTKILPTNDAASVIQALVARVEKLERQNLLLHAAIDSQPGLAVKVPEGIDVKPGGSVAVEGADGLDVKSGGSIKIGTAGKIGQSGDKIGLDGAVHVKGGVNTDGGVVSEGIVQGREGLRTPWGSGTGLVKDIMEGIKSTADTALANADSKPTKAYVDAGDSASMGRANDAYSLADSKPTVAYVDGAVATRGSKSKQDEIIDALNNLESFVREMHPSKPIYPPIVKG